MRLRLLLEYDGTDFHGWQLQPGLRTVQGDLEEALEKMMGAPVRVHGSGRTDAGVHALAQVAHFDAPRSIPPDHVGLGLNSILPRDVRVLTCEEADPSFHARFSAKGKRYRYIVLNRSRPTALLRNRAWSVREPLDLDRMREGAFCLLGRRDFTSFRSAGEEGSAERDLRVLDIAREGEEVVFTLEADGFLKHMVRNIVGPLVLVGKGKLVPDDIFRLLKARTRLDSPKAAPPQGLFLVEVYY